MKSTKQCIFICVILTALLGLVFVSCSGDDPSIEAYDEDVPHLLSVSPADSTSDVPVTTSLSLGFDEAMVPSTIYFNTEDDDCSGSLQLSQDDFKSCVQLAEESLSYSEDQQTFSVTPQMPLDGFQKYKIRVTTAVKDLALNRLEQEYVMVDGFMTGPGVGGPESIPKGVYFGDENTKENELTGAIKIEPADDESDINGYNIYWGSSDSKRLSSSSLIAFLPKSYEYLDYELTDVPIPEGATHFLVYSTNEKGDSASPAFLDIPDTVLRKAFQMDMSGNGGPHSFHVWNDKLYFSASVGTDGAELWEYDGISDPVMAADIWPGPDSSMINATEMIEFGNSLCFQARAWGYNNTELWCYDGFVATEVDINQISDGGSTFGSFPQNFAVLNGKLYYTATDGTNGFELWFYNGAMSPIPGTDYGMVADIYTSGDSFISHITPFFGKLYFGADDSGFSNQELWQYSGITPTAAKYTSDLDMVFNISATSAFVDQLTVYKEKLYFTANNDDINGQEIWYYNGSSTPTIDVDYGLLSDINGGPPGSNPKEFTEHNDMLFFSANNGFDGDELFAYDGVSAPTMVADINPSGGSGPSSLTGYGPILIFSAETSEYGRELFGFSIEDGEFFEIADINEGVDSSFPNYLTVFQERLYFTATEDGINYHPWVFYIK